MKRLIDFYLKEWKEATTRKPLLLRGARQVGKTSAVRTLGNLFPHFLEVNLENYPEAAEVFEHGNFDPHRIIKELSERLKVETPVFPGRTLLFIDEIQVVPRAITALRYFYEQMPDLHVIAAGSLLDFAIQEVGVPVGRVEFHQMYPMSFLEFLSALDEKMMIEEIINHTADEPIADYLLTKGLNLVGEYLAIGGLPEAVKKWALIKEPYECFKVHQSITSTYQQDFNKYAKRFQIKYLNALFKGVPVQLGKKFNYSSIPGEFRKRDLSPALDLLETANIVHKVQRTAAQGIPLGSQIDPDDSKVILLDVALSQALLGLDLGFWITNPLEQFINKGNLVEAFIGQEIISYADSIKKEELYYWAREKAGSEAEVDYVIQQGERVIPIEVKSGKGTTLKSMQMFLESHPNSPYGIRFSTNNYSIHQKIHSYPLFAVAKIIMKDKRLVSALL